MSTVGNVAHSARAAQVIAPATSAPPSVPPALTAAFAHCAQVTRRRARNFYYGLRLTPEPRRSAIYSVYAWMRCADDEADAAATVELKHQRLDVFRTTTEAMVAGRPMGAAESDPVWLAFRETVRRYSLSPADLRAMLDGLDADLALERREVRDESGAPLPAYARREDVAAYCYRVASTVGLICLDVWGLAPEADRERARTLAERRGLAFQLTNILRDFSQDYAEGRVYISASEFADHGLTPAALRAWTTPEDCAALVRAVAAWARAEYARSAPLEGLIDPACVPALRAMTGIYSGLLGVIERFPERVVSRKRIRLRSYHKATIAARALLESWAARRASVTP